MSKLLKTSKYLGYPINTAYKLKQSNMKEIYLALAHARDTIDRPIALRYTIGLDNNHSFDINKLTRKIKSLFKDGYSFIYSFEYAEYKGLHLEMMLVVDQNKHNPLTVFNLLRKVLFNLNGVTINIEQEYKKVSFNFHERKEEYLSDSGGSKVGHNLKNAEQFKDCMYRASYLAKQDDKQQVQYKKTFGTTTG
ncbi:MULTISPECIES: inovirus-type Gp2 protein [unclassified Acinetobacter]|uniref:YagK/YfjJ domain-containing protein n=4 Tax=Acinetobacter TaxID=469 RepID=UPI0015D35689|nr:MULTISPECIES: inovirus-type Gp2 protein [unclassified Acinetobacter]